MKNHINKYTGKKIANRYFITGEIGKGGMGIVFSAIPFDDPSQTVAIKIIFREQQISPEDLLRFQKEAALMSRLYHPNIISFYELGLLNEENNELNFEKNSGYYIVMEFAIGKNLKESLNRDGKKDISFFLQVAIQISAALDYMHRKNIVHRDIKPQNIIVGNTPQDPKGLSVKVLDFGVSRLIEAMHLSTSNNIDKKAFEDMAGTPLYMAPEQTSLMDAPVDHRVDLYSLGCVLYEILAGHPPFMAKTRAQLEREHVYSKVPNLISIRPDIPPIISDIITKLLQKHPDERYQTAFALYTDLLRIKRKLERKEHYQNINFPLAINDRFLSISSKVPLLERTNELETLKQVYNMVAQPKGRAMLITINGKFGIGKSTILNEFKKYLSQKKIRFINADFSQHETALPFNALANAFNDYLLKVLQHSPYETEEIRRKIKKMLGEVAFDIAAVIPALAPFICDMQCKKVKLDISQIDFKMFTKAFTDFIRCLAIDNEPIVFLFDDLHWADEKSLKLIEYFFSYNNSHKFLLVISYDENDPNTLEEFDKFLTKFKQLKRRFQQIHLKPLSYNSTISLTQNLLGTKNTIPSDLAQHIYLKTNGNPLYIIESIKILIAKDLIHFSRKLNDWQYDVELITKIDLNLNIIDLTIQKISTLKEFEKHILNIAAIAGMSFQFEILRLHVDNYEINSVDILNFINKALDLNIIIKIPDDAELKELGKSYAFTHWRLRDFLYKQIPINVRHNIHKLIAFKLEKYVSETKSKTLFNMVHHLNKACLNQKTIDIKTRQKLIKYNVLAGKIAKDLGSWQSAQGYFEIAYTQAQGFPQTNYNSNDIASIIENIGDILYLQKMFGTAIKYYENALTYKINKNLWTSLNYKILNLNIINGLYTKSVQHAEYIIKNLKLDSLKLNLFKKILLYLNICTDLFKIIIGVGNPNKIIHQALMPHNIQKDQTFNHNIVKIYNTIAYLHLQTNPLLSIYYHYKSYKLCLNTNQTPQNTLKTLAEHTIILSKLGLKKISYGILESIIDTAKNADYYNIYGYALLIKAIFLDYPYLKDDEISEQIHNALRNISPNEDRIAFTIGVIFQLYRELIKGRLQKALKIAKIIPDIIPTRNHLNAKAMAIVFYTYLLSDSRDSIVKLGELYIKRRQTVAARPDDMFIRIINTIITFAKGEIEKTRTYYSSVIKDFINSKKETLFLPFLQDFIFLFAHTLPALFEQEYGRQILRNSELKPLWILLNKKLNKTYTKNTAIIKLVKARTKELLKHKNIKILYDEALIQSKTSGYYLIQAFSYLWFGNYLLNLGYKKRINYIFKVYYFSIYNKIKLLIEYAEKILEKNNVEFKKFNTSLSIQQQNKTEPGIFNFNFILEHITHLSEALIIETFLEQNIQESIEICKKYFKYQSALLITNVKNTQEQYEILYKSDDNNQNNYKTKIAYIKPYMNIKTTLFLPYYDAPWTKHKIFNQNQNNKIIKEDTSYQNIKYINTDNNNKNITIMSPKAINTTLILNSKQDESLNNIDNEYYTNNYQDKTLLASTSILNPKSKNKNLNSTNVIIPILGSKSNIGILFLENINLKSHKMLFAKNQLDIFGIHLGIMIEQKSDKLTISETTNTKPTSDNQDNINASLIYKPASYCIESCSWLKTWHYGQLRQKRESVWFLGLKLDNNQYILIYCRLNGIIEIREKLSAILWYYFKSIKITYTHLDSLNLQIDNIKKDITSLLLKFLYTKDLESISIAFTIFNKEKQTAYSGHFGTSRPIVIFQQNDIMPTNEVIITLQNGRDIRFWYVKAELHKPHIYILSHDSSKIELNYSETFTKNIANINFKQYNTEKLIKLLQSFIPIELLPRYYVGAIMLEDNNEEKILESTKFIA